MKKVKRTKEEPKPLEMILTKKENKSTRTRPPHSSNSAASLVVMNPHSFEQAKKEYMLYVQRFSGIYEMLYLACSGKGVENGSGPIT
ncbi:hypothetical protein [Desulfitobacterium sp. PCE1]|uniref:hypothetical protein n=1 Tax=Desulfitobacterium sp. PCE1 TaxID=146907 RepID=UPI001FA7D01E|nr:hypothetical protein [Desulfitobacterium sp. PCE1]